MESSFQNIRIIGLDTNKSHNLPSLDGTHRIYLTLSSAPPATWRDIFHRGVLLPVATSGVGCPNRLLSVDRFLDSRCQSRLSSAWWRSIFKAVGVHQTVPHGGP